MCASVFFNVLIDCYDTDNTITRLRNSLTELTKCDTVTKEQIDRGLAGETLPPPWDFCTPIFSQR